MTEYVATSTPLVDVGEPTLHDTDTTGAGVPGFQLVVDSDGDGTADHGTPHQWRGAFPGANVLEFGFSLGSGVQGDGVLDAIDFADTRSTFAEQVVLTGKDECEDGGWPRASASAPS